MTSSFLIKIYAITNQNTSNSNNNTYCCSGKHFQKLNLKAKNKLFLIKLKILIGILYLLNWSTLTIKLFLILKSFVILFSLNLTFKLLVLSTWRHHELNIGWIMEDGTYWKIYIWTPRTPLSTVNRFSSRVSRVSVKNKTTLLLHKFQVCKNKNKL